MSPYLLDKSIKETVRTRADLAPKLRQCLDLRNRGRVPRNSELFLTWIKRIKHRDICLLLAIISWYLIPELKVYIQLNLVDFELKKMQPEDQLKIRLCLYSKATALQVYADHHSECDWFGNHLPQMIELVSSLRFQWLIPKTRKKQDRKRGYSDHGSRRPADRWLPDGDQSLTDLQMQIEEERKAWEDTYLLLVGFLE